jgi:secondary thiamine-phosphate synthase enzyme
MVYQKEIRISSSGFDSIIDITDHVRKIVAESKINTGIVNVFNIGSTASITTIEYEPGLTKDLPLLLNKIIPRGNNYNHDNTWHDGNGDAHLKASLIGPDITCPISGNNIMLGTWQQIILIDSDNKHRTRKVLITVIGE